VIVVDTSALIAILLAEPEARSFGQIIYTASPALVAAPTLLEYHMVADSHARRSGVSPDTVIEGLGLIVEPWTIEHLHVARAAFRRFGKGQGHPAQLNYGDCMSYALAKAMNVPLLFKGGDFALTDVNSAL
jgi:ribonuclease VapC